MHEYYEMDKVQAGTHEYCEIDRGRGVRKEKPRRMEDGGLLAFSETMA